jgi:hypothetical protein
VEKEQSEQEKRKEEQDKVDSNKKKDEEQQDKIKKAKEREQKEKERVIKKLNDSTIGICFFKTLNHRPFKRLISWPSEIWEYPLLRDIYSCKR